jgi:hypothetical protein
MAAFTVRTFGDIVAAVREEAKISGADTTSLNRIKRDINAIYSEVISYKRWWWLVDSMTVNVPAFYGTNLTARVINGSSLVKMSQVLNIPKTGYFFSVDGDAEIYTVESHTVGTDELRLSQTYNGATNFAMGFKIWSDHIPLPTNCKETVEILSPFTRQPLENLGLQEYRRYTSALPKREGNPEAYYTGDFLEPFPTAAIPSMPSLLEHSSSGVVKTLVFNAAIPASITANTVLQISGASHPSFNGEISVARIATTNVANDTLIYTGKEEYTETTTPDPGLSIQLVITTANRSRYRALYFHPCLTKTNLTHYVDYQKNVPPLELDSDEPLIPLDDRMVLLYGALQRTWRKERNPEEAATNLALYTDKLARMAGQMQDSLDKPILKPSRIYLGTKRSSFRSRRFNLTFDGFSGASGSSGGGSVATLGTPNTVAIFNASGVLEGSSVISVTELNYLDNASSNIQAQIDTITATLASAFVVDATVAAGAAIARSKLASGTANAVVINNGSGVMADSSVTSTELSFLTGVTPLTTVVLNNNQAVAAPAITIPQANTFCFILYSISRGLTNYEGGYMVLLNDASTTADLIIDSASILTTGVSLTADVSGGNVRVLYTSTNTGFTAQLKYAVIKWAA